MMNEVVLLIQKLKIISTLYIKIKYSLGTLLTDVFFIHHEFGMFVTCITKNVYNVIVYRVRQV